MLGSGFFSKRKQKEGLFGEIHEFLLLANVDLKSKNNEYINRVGFGFPPFLKELRRPFGRSHKHVLSMKLVQRRKERF